MISSTMKFKQDCMLPMGECKHPLSYFCTTNLQFMWVIFNNELMLDCSLKKYSLKLLINKHIRHVLYLQFTMNVFQIYFLNAVNEVIFYNDLKLDARFFVYPINALGAQ